MVATPKMIGEPIKRKEDPRLVSGTGRYVDDIVLPRMAHAATLRSDRAHARIRRIDVEAARRMPGVLAVYTGKDLEGRLGTVPCGVKDPEGNHYLAGVPINIPDYPVAAIDKVGFVGQNVAVVVAEDPYLAQDALDAIQVDYEDLPVVVDPEKAASPDSPAIHEEFGSNIVFHIPGGPSPEAIAETDKLFGSAQHTASFRIDNQRLIPMALEPRAVLADFDPGREEMTVWSSSQIPHLARTLLALLLSVPETQVRFIAPDVGGGFGSKLQVYPEEILVPYLSRELGRPVKWIEKRSEGFTSTIHGRGQVQHIDIAFNGDGTWVAMKSKLYFDLGAYMQLLTPGIGGFTAAMMLGCYRPQGMSFEQIGVFTNKMATDAYRGAGRPEATLIAERVMDVIARELDMDPAEVRRRNFLTEFPATMPTGMIYDSGDYNKALDKALEVVDYKTLRQRQAAARAEGRLVGIGLSSYVEISGFGPSAIAPPGVGWWDAATVRVEKTGTVSVLLGISPHGQGQETTFAQIAAEELGVPMDAVRVLHSDTATTPYGNGTYGSRGQAMGGGALMMSLGKVKDKARQIAAHLLDVRPDNVTYENGEAYVTSEPSRRVGLAEIAMTVYDFGWKGPGTAPTDIEPGLEATSRFEASNFTYPFGTHVCEVEIDRDTGQVEVRRYVAVDDCGRVINPLIVDGQVHGGLAQGIAQALYEEAVYDEGGQLITGELTDYAVPKSIMLPRFETDHTVTPTPVNPLGAKGVGEAGTIGSTAAVFNAVLDALAPLGVKHLDMPFKPEKVWKAIQGKQS